MLALFMEPAPLLKIRMLIVLTAFSTAFDLAHSNWKVDYGALLHVSLHELDDFPKSSGFSSYYLLYLTCLLLWITWFIKNSFHPCLLKREKEVTKDNIRRDSEGSLTLKKKNSVGPSSELHKKRIMNERKCYCFCFAHSKWLNLHLNVMVGLWLKVRTFTFTFKIFMTQMSIIFRTWLSA